MAELEYECVYEVRYVGWSCQVGLLVADTLSVSLERVEVDHVVWYQSRMCCVWIRNVGIGGFGKVC